MASGTGRSRSNRVRRVSEEMVEEVEDIAAEKEVEISATAGYVFLREVDYDPNGRHYIIGEKSQLTDWTPEHIESALSVGLIAEEVEYG